MSRDSRYTLLKYVAWACTAVLLACFAFLFFVDADTRRGIFIFAMAPTLVVSFLAHRLRQAP